MTDDAHVTQLRELIQSAKAGALSIKDFCKSFERIYNLELDKKSVPSDELRALAALFGKVVWYSPYPEERATIPHYLGEAEIRQALSEFEVQVAASKSGNRDVRR